jgi:hypothetical protein
LIVLLICNRRLIVVLIVLLGLSHQRGARHQCRNCKYANNAVKSSHRNLPGEQLGLPMRRTRGGRSRPSSCHYSKP